jgi:hypothetical protein
MSDSMIKPSRNKLEGFFYQRGRAQENELGAQRFESH